MFSKRIIHAGLGLYALGLLIMACAFDPAPLFAAQASNLRGQIEALAEEHGFALLGGTKIDELPVSAVPDGPIDEQLRVLLSDHNFIIVRSGSGDIRSVRVSGRKGPPPDLTKKVTVNTVRRGSNHYLEATVLGANGTPVTIPLMLDTGASAIVLPTSMLERLGFSESDIREVTLQTANGETSGWLGVLKSVEVGNAYERDVAVAFVEAEKLGNKMLMGMSFLSRYIITIDDQTNLLSLERRDN